MEGAAYDAQCDIVDGALVFFFKSAQLLHTHSYVPRDPICGHRVVEAQLWDGLAFWPRGRVIGLQNLWQQLQQCPGEVNRSFDTVPPGPAVFSPPGRRAELLIDRLLNGHGLGEGRGAGLRFKAVNAAGQAQRTFTVHNRVVNLEKYCRAASGNTFQPIEALN